jgi:homopolymeric O-antigen transport system permease protein
VTSATTTRLRRIVDLVVHLTAREYRVRYQAPVLGWAWAVLPPLVRLLVLGVIFTVVLPVDQEDYVAMLAIGLLGWTWFSAGVSSATRSASDRVELLSQPRVPREVVPLVSVLTDAMDYVAALPVVLVVVIEVSGRLPPTVLLLVPLLLLQGALVFGLGAALSVADVRFRDARFGVDLMLAVGFYATPVFYSLNSLPEGVRQIVALNPLAVLLEAQRDVVVRGVVPSTATWLLLTAVSLLVATTGTVLHRRASGLFLDSL